MDLLTAASHKPASMSIRNLPNEVSSIVRTALPALISCKGLLPQYPDHTSAVVIPLTYITVIC